MLSFRSMGVSSPVAAWKQKYLAFSLCLAYHERLLWCRMTSPFGHNYVSVRSWVALFDFVSFTGYDRKRRWSSRGPIAVPDGLADAASDFCKFLLLGEDDSLIRSEIGPEAVVEMKLREWLQCDYSRKILLPELIALHLRNKQARWHESAVRDAGCFPLRPDNAPMA